MILYTIHDVLILGYTVRHLLYSCISHDLVQYDFIDDTMYGNSEVNINVSRGYL